MAEKKAATETKITPIKKKEDGGSASIDALVADVQTGRDALSELSQAYNLAEPAAKYGVAAGVALALGTLYANTSGQRGAMEFYIGMAQWFLDEANRLYGSGPAADTQARTQPWEPQADYRRAA